MIRTRASQQLPHKMTTNSDTSLRGIRTLLKWILAVLLLRTGMDYTPIGKGDSGVMIGLVSLVSGVGLICWMGVSLFNSFFDRLGASEEIKNDPPNGA